MASAEQGSPSGIEKDLDHLKKAFISDKTKFKEVIFQLFESQDNPYRYFLLLVPLVDSPKGDKPNKLLSKIFSSFESWSKKSTNSEPPSTRLQKIALRYAMDFGNGDVLETILRIFRINERSDDAITEHNRILNREIVIEEHYKKGNLEMVAQAVKLFNLQENFSFNGFYFPLLCFDLKNELKNCLGEDRDLKQQFIEGMDELYISWRKMDQAINSVDERFSKKRSKLNCELDSIKKEAKYYRQAMNEFLREWDIPLENCVNYFKEKRRLAISYLVAIYRNEEIYIEGLAEMVAVAIGNEKDLIKFAVDKLFKFDRAAAGIVNARLRNPKLNQQIRHAKSAGASSSAGDFLKLSLNANEVIFVDDPVVYEKSVEDVSKCKEIGFDTEWQPTFGWGKEKIALLQIATRDKVYLFDVLALTKHLSNNWDSLANKVFYNTDMLKIGFGIRTDLDHFKERFMGNSEELFAKNLQNFMDMKVFFSWVLKLHPKIRQVFGLPDVDEKSPNKNDESSKKNDGDGKSSGRNDAKKDVDEDGVTKGLSGLCQLLLGKPLNKRDQISDWERRPLRESQKLYAALDAFCLLKMLQRVEDVLKTFGFVKTDTIRKFFEEEEKKKSEAVGSEKSLEDASA